jgi:nicotinamidase/pyrazinamidase
MTALLLLDFQQDFFELGTTSAKHADSNLIKIANRLIAAFPTAAAVNDAHPANHQAFAANHLWRRPWQTLKIDEQDTLLWPMHAVADSFGAEMPPELESEKLEKIFKKGSAPHLPGYSAFEIPEFRAWLQQNTIHHLVCIGTLLEYSVLHTASDAIRHGLKATVLPEACGFLELQDGDKEKSLQMMTAKKVRIAALSNFLDPTNLRP